MEKPKVIVIGGPTASGKTALGIEVAKKLETNIISCDSMQIYKDMDIGTAKPTKQEQSEVKHELIDFVLPDQRYSVAQFKQDAIKKMDEIIEKGKIPVLVGGTGLYIESLVRGIDYPDMPYDTEYRNYIQKIAKEEGIEKLYSEALKIDEDAAKKISSKDEKRIIRILEIYHATGKTKTEQEKESRKNGIKYDYYLFGITMDRNKLYERIDKRVDIMIEQGLINEVEEILKKYDSFPTAMQGLGYKEVVEYLQGKIKKDEMIEKIKKETRHYAKRQLTWFRHYDEMVWLNTEDGIDQNVSTILEKVGGRLWKIKGK